MKQLPFHKDFFDDPLFTQRNPYQTFLLASSIAASYPLIFTGKSSSGVIATTLDSQAAYAWGYALLIGSVIALVGQYWPGRTWAALVFERSGLGIVAGAATIYSLIVFTNAPDKTDIAYVIGIQVAYAFATAWRCWQITSRLKWINKVLEKSVKPR